MTTIIACNECLTVSQKHIPAKWKLSYNSGYHLCEAHYTKLPITLQPRFVKLSGVTSE